MVTKGAEYASDRSAGFDAVKHVVSPIYEAAPRDRLRGLYEDFGNVSARVLLLRGEVHWGRKPVRITTLQ